MAIPDGSHVSVTHSGKCILKDNVTLLDVLLILAIKFNSLSVPKLVSDTRMVVTFNDEGCYFQDRATHTSQQLGCLDQILFQLKQSQSRRCAALYS